MHDDKLFFIRVKGAVKLGVQLRKLDVQREKGPLLPEQMQSLGVQIVDDQNFEEQDPNNFDQDWELETLKYSTLSFWY